MKKKKAKPTERLVRCPYCGSHLVLRPASEIYQDQTHDGNLLVCSRYPACNTYVGTHPGTNVPMGTPANGDLRNLRIKAHREFDRLWKEGVMSRDAAYRWLADSFGLRLRDAHIGMCGEYQCKAIIEKCHELRAFRAGLSA